MGGLMDLRLTVEGEKLTKNMAEHIQKMNFDVIFCSPNQRALTTMELSCHLITAPRIISEPLREQSYGIMTGKKIDEIPYEVDQLYFENPYSFSHTSGESLEDVVNRVGLFIENEVMKSRYQNILLITHENVIRGAIGYLRKLSLEVVNMKFANCSLTAYEFT